MHYRKDVAHEVRADRSSTPNPSSNGEGSGGTSQPTKAASASLSRRFRFLKLEDRKLLSTLIGITGADLVVQDENSDQADDVTISVSDDGSSIVIRDDTQTLTTTIANANVISPHEIRIDIADLQAAGVTGLVVETGDLADHISLDLDQHTTTFLEQFQAIQIDAGQQVGDAMTIAGDGSMDVDATLSHPVSGATATLNLSSADVRGGTVDSDLVFTATANGNPINLKDVDTLTVRDASVDTAVEIRNAQHSNSADPALRVRFTSGADANHSLLVSSVGHLKIDEGASGLDGTTQVLVEGSGAAGIGRLTIDTGVGVDEVTVDGVLNAQSGIDIIGGEVRFESNVTVVDGKLNVNATQDVFINADLTARSGEISIQSDGSINQLATSTINVSSPRNSLDGGDVLVSAAGGIQLEGTIDARGGQTAAGDGTDGGSINIVSLNGDVLVSSLKVDGGNAINTPGLNGGNAGTISINNQTVGGLITIDGELSAAGGAGSAGGSNGIGGLVQFQGLGELNANAALPRHINARQVLIDIDGSVGDGGPILINTVQLDVTAGYVQIEDLQGGLTLADLNGDNLALDVVGGVVQAHSPLIISSNVNTSSSLTLIAGDSASAGDDIKIISGAVVTLTSASAGQVLTLQAGDDIEIVDGAVVTTGADHVVNLVADHESDLGVADGDGGTVTQTIVGATVVDTAQLNINASNGIGTGARLFTFDAKTLSTDSSANAGDQYLADAAGNIAIEQVNAGAGNLWLHSAGNVTDATIADTQPNIVGDQVQIVAAGGVGVGANGSIDLAVDTIAVDANNNVNLTSDVNLKIGTVGAVSGIQSGSPGVGGAINVTVQGTLDVLAAVTSATGAGGDLTLDGVNVQATVHAGGGSVTLVGSNPDLVIDADVSSAGDVSLRADRDVIISALVDATGAGKATSITADQEGNGNGGVRITAAGAIVSAGTVDVRGSDLDSTGASVDAIVIDADGANDQIQAAGTITLGTLGATPATSDTIVHGRLTTTGAGGITIDAADKIVLGTTLTTNGGTAQFQSAVVLDGNSIVDAGNGGITFDSSIDGAFALTLDGDATTLIQGAVGQNGPLASLTIAGPGDIQLQGGLVRTTGDQTYGDDVLLGANTIFTTANNLSFQGDLKSSGADRDVTITAAVDDLTVSGVVDLKSLNQTGGAGTTTLSGGTIKNDLTINNNAFVLNGNLTTNTLGGSGVVITTADGQTFNASLDATAGTIDLNVNQDGLGAQSFVQASGTQIVTTNGSVDAININVEGTGSAQLALLKTGGNGRISITAGGAISDNNAAAQNLISKDAVLVAGTSVGGGNAIDMDVDTIAVDANAQVNLTDSDDLVIGTVGAVSGITSGGPGAGGAISVTALGTLDVLAAVSSATGTGGNLTLDGVNVQASVDVGAGNVSLIGNSPDLIIDGNLSSSGDITLQADRDVIISATIDATGAGKLTLISADLDADGSGGVRLTAAGAVTSAGTVKVQGSDLAATGGVLDAVVIDADGANNQIQAAGAITLGIIGATPAGSDTYVHGRVTSTGNGNITIKAADKIFLGTNLTSNGGNASLQSAVVLDGNSVIDVGAGAITFDSTIDGGFGLTLDGDATTLVQGAIGQTTALASLNVVGPGNIELNGGLVNTTGNQTYAGDVLLGANTTFTSSGDLQFQDALKSSGADRDVTISASVDDVTVSGLVDLRSINQLGGSGTTTLSGGTLKNNLSIDTNAFLLSGNLTTNTLGGTGVVITTANGQTFNANLDATAGTIDLNVNQDGVGTQSLVQALGSQIVTTDGSTNAINVDVAGTGSAQIGLLKTGGAGRITMTVGGSIIDNNGASQNLASQTAALTAGSAVGGGNALEIDVDTIAVDANAQVALIDSDDLTIGTVGAVSGIQSGSPGSGGPISVTALGALDVLAAVTSATGTGGNLTLDGANIQASVHAGAGSVSLIGNSPDLVINGNISSGGDITLTADRDVIVSATINATGAGKTTLLSADSDSLGDGGVHLKASGAITSAGDVKLQGSDLVSTAAVVDAVVIDADGASDQIQASGSITLGILGSTPAGSDTYVHGRLTSTGAGNITIKAADKIFLGTNLTSNGGNASLQSAVVLDGSSVIDVGAGAITFDSTIDGGFALTLDGDATTLVQGAIGQTTALASLNVVGPGNVELNGGLVKTTGNQTYGGDVLLGANTTFTSNADLLFQNALKSSGADRDVTISASVDDVTVSGLVDLRSINQLGGSGTTTLSGGTLKNNLSIDTNAFLLSGNLTTNTLGGSGVVITTANGQTFNANLNATAGTIDLNVNQDGVGAQGFVQSATSQITTSSNASSAIDIAVAGAGAADLGRLQAGNSGGRIRIDAAGAINDANAASLNLVADQAALISGAGVGTGNALELDLNTVAVAAQGEVRLSDIDDLKIGTVGATSGITSGGPGAGGLINVVAAGALQVLQSVSSATGSGGDLTLDGVDVQATIHAGAGNVTLQGGGLNLTIAANISGSGNLDLRADQDIIVSADIDATGAGTTTTLVADNDGNSTGGVQVKAAGRISSAGSVSVFGSDVSATAGQRDAIDIQADGANNQIVAAGNISLLNNAAAPPQADTIIHGRVTSTGSGNITVDAADQIILGANLTSNGGDASLQAATVIDASVTIDVSAGGIHFASSINGPFSLTLDGDAVTQIDGSVGATNALASLTIAGPGDIQLNGGSVTTTGNQEYQADVSLGSNTLFSSGADLIFAAGLGSTGPARAVTIAASVNDVTVGGALDLSSFSQFGGSGTTTLNGGTLTSDLSINTNIFVLDGALSTNQVGGTGVTIATLNGQAFNANLDAGNKSIDIDVNLDGVGSQSFVQASGTQIVTSSNAVDAIDLFVGGTGNALLSLLQTGTGAGTIRIEAGGAISDNNGAGDNLIAGLGALISGNGVGATDTLEIDLGVVAVQTQGDVRLLELSDIVIGSVLGIDGVDSGAIGLGGEIDIEALGAMDVFEDVSSAGGFGGNITIIGANVIANVNAGDGDIRLVASSLDLIINGNLTTTGDRDLIAARDIIVNAIINATGVGSLTSLLADRDGDGVGGVQIRTIGGIISAGSVVLKGSDLYVTSGVVDAIDIQADLVNAQISAKDNITLDINAVAPAQSDVLVHGRLTSTGGGDVSIKAADLIKLGANVSSTGGQIHFLSAVELDGASIVDADAGAITFDSTIDGGFSLILDGDSTTHVEGAIGQNAALASLTVLGPGDIQLNGGLVQTSGSQFYGDDVLLGADTTFTTSNNLSFQGDLKSSGADRDVTITAAVDDVTVNGLVDLRSFNQLGGSGTTALNGGNLNNNLAIDTNSFVLSGNLTTNVLGGSGVVITTGNGQTFNASLDASAGTIDLNVNQDGIGTQGLVQLAGTQIVTSDGSINAVAIDVSGTGSAQLGLIQSGTTGRISITAGGSISDNNGASQNLVSQDAVLVAGAAVGSGNALEIDVDTIAVDANAQVNLIDSDDLVIGTVGAVSGIQSGSPGSGGAISVTALGTLDVLATVTSATGTGGNLTLDGVNVQATVHAGAGSVTLVGSNADLVIDANVSSGGDLSLKADQDVLVNALVNATGLNKQTTIFADQDADGSGGIRVFNVASIVSSGNVKLVGSDLVSTAGAVDAIVIDSDGANSQISAAGDIVLDVTGAAPLLADTIVRGHLTSTGSGDIMINASNQVLLAADLTSNGGDARLQQRTTLDSNVDINVGAGAITFDSTIDGGFALTLDGDATTLVQGAIGQTTALASLNVVGPGNVQLNGGLVNTTGNQTYGGDVLIGANTTFTSNADLLFQNALKSNGADRDVTISASVDDVTVSGLVDLQSINQLGGSGTTTLNGGTLKGDLSIDTNAFVLGGNLTTNTLGGSGVVITTANGQTFNANLNATAGTIDLNVNQDGVGAQGFVQSATSQITTSSNSSSAIDIVVAGAGAADLGRLQAGNSGGRIRIDAAGAINDANAGSLNLVADQAALISGAGVGTGNALELDLNTVAVAAQGEVRLSDIDDLKIGTVGATSGITSGGPGAGGLINVVAQGALQVLQSVSSASGSGGDLTLDGVDVQATVHAGAGNVTLQGGGPDLLVGSAIDATGNVTLRASRDVIISDDVQATGAGTNLFIQGDRDLNGVGGVLLQSSGSILAVNVEATGSDVFATVGLVDAVHIENDGNTDQLEAVGDILLRSNASVALGSDLVIAGRVNASAGGSIDFDANDQTFISTRVASDDGVVTFHDATVLTGDSVVDVNAGGIFFQSTINGGFDLTLNASGTTQIIGTVGGTAALDSLTTDAGGETRLRSLVRTFGGQDYGDALILEGATTLRDTSGSTIHVASTINDDGLGASSSALAIDTAGLTKLDGAIGQSDRISSLNIQALGTTTFGGGNILTTGDQTYSDALSLATDAMLSTNGGDIRFDSTVDSIGVSRELFIDANANDVTFADLVTLKSLRQISGTGTTVINGGTIDGLFSITTDRVELHGATLNTNTVFAQGAEIVADNAVIMDASLTAGIATISIDVNQDGAGNQSFTQTAGTLLSTTNNSANAISIDVGGSGNANLSLVQAGSANGRIAIDVGGSINDINAGSMNLRGFEASLKAQAGIGTGDSIETDLSALAATTVSGAINISEVDALRITTVGAVSGVSITSGANSNEIVVVAGGTVAVEQAIDNDGSGDIRIDASGISLDTANADISTAVGSILLDANTGTLASVAGASVSAPLNVQLIANDVTLAATSLIETRSSGGTVQIAAHTAGRTIGLGDSATGGLNWTSAELNTIDSDIVRIGVVGGGSFDGSTSGAINVRDLTVDANFATSFLALRTLSSVTGGGDIDLGASGANLAIRSEGIVDLTSGAGQRDLNVVAVTTNGSTARVHLNDNTNGMVIGTVDGVSGITTGAGSVQITTEGVNSDLRVLADIQHEGSGSLELVSDDSIFVASGINLIGTGSGLMRLQANADNATGISGGGLDRDSIVLADGSVLNASLGKIELRTNGSALVGGDIHLSQLITQNTSLDAVVVAADGAVVDAGNVGGADVIADDGGVQISARSGIGSSDAIELSTGRLLVENAGPGVSGEVNLRVLRDVRVDGLLQEAANTTIVVDGSLTTGGTLESGQRLVVTVADSVRDLAGDTGLDLVSPVLIVTAQTGIGAFDAIEMSSSDVSMEVLTGGAIRLVNHATSDVIVRRMDTVQGDLSLNQDGSQNLRVVSATTSNGDIEIRNDGGDLTLNEVQTNGAGASVLVQTTLQGDIIVDRVESNNGSIRVLSTGRIQELATDGAADLKANRVTLVSDEGMGIGNAVEVSAPRISADVLQSGDLSLRVVTVSTTVLDASIAGSGDALLTTTTAALELLDVSTFDGSITTLVTGHDLLARRIEAGGSGDIDLRTLDDGELTIDQLIALGDRIQLLSAKSIEQSMVDGNDDLISAELVLGAETGIGSSGVLQTRVDLLEAHSQRGGVLLHDDGTLFIADLSANVGVAGVGVSSTGASIEVESSYAMTVLGSVLHAGVGDIRLEVLDQGTLSAFAPILNSSGNVFLTAGDTADSGLVIYDSLPNGQAEVYAGGGGRVVGNAGGAVQFVYNHGSQVLIATDTGTATSVAPLITVIPLDQGGSDVTAIGNVWVDVILRSVGGEVNRNYGLTLDWHDVVNPIDVFPTPGNPASNPSVRFDTGVYRFFHNYSLGNPDAENPANDIPFAITVHFDARDDGQGGLIYGIQFFSNGKDVSQTHLEGFLTVPGDGLFAGIVVPPNEIDRIQELAPAPIVLTPVAPPPVSEQGEQAGQVALLEDDVRSEQPKLFYRVVGVTGESSTEEYELPLDFLDESRLFEFFKQLPNGQYNVYFKDAGEDDVQLLFELNVNDHRLIPADAEAPPSSNDGASEFDGAVVPREVLNQSLVMRLEDDGRLENATDSDKAAGQAVVAFGQQALERREEAFNSETDATFLPPLSGSRAAFDIEFPLDMTEGSQESGLGTVLVEPMASTKTGSESMSVPTLAPTAETEFSQESMILAGAGVATLATAATLARVRMARHFAERDREEAGQNDSLSSSFEQTRSGSRGARLVRRLQQLTSSTRDHESP